MAGDDKYEIIYKQLKAGRSRWWGGGVVERMMMIQERGHMGDSFTYVIRIVCRELGTRDCGKTKS